MVAFHICHLHKLNASRLRSVNRVAGVVLVVFGAFLFIGEPDVVPRTHPTEDPCLDRRGGQLPLLDWPADRDHVSVVARHRGRVFQHAQGSLEPGQPFIESLTCGELTDRCQVGFEGLTGLGNIWARRDRSLGANA